VADRKASVSLELKANQFKAEATVVELKIELVDRKVEKLDKDITKIPPDAAKAAAAMRLLGDDAGKVGAKLDTLGRSSTSMSLLDQRILHTRGELRRLADEFNRTGDSGTLQKLFKADADVKGLERLRKQLTSAFRAGITDVGKEAPGMFASIGASSGRSFFSAFSSLPPQAQAAIVAAVAGVITASAPFIGAAVNGALLAGVGAGGLALGIAGQIHDPRIEAAGTALAEHLKRRLTEASAPLGPALLSSIERIDGALGRTLGRLEPGFARLAPTLERLSRGAEGFLDRATPGFVRGMEAGAVVLDRIADELPRLGQVLGRFFDMLAAGSSGAADAVHYLFAIIEGTTMALGVMLRTLSQNFQLMELAVALATSNWAEAARILAEMRGGAQQATPALAGLGDAVGGLTREVDNQKRAVDGLTSAWDKWFGVSMNVNEATLRYNQDLLAFKESLAQSRGQWDLATKAGQDHYAALLQLIRTTHDLRQAQIDSGVSAAQANDTYQRSIDTLLALAAKYGLSASQVQSLRAQVGGLKDSLNSLPPAVAPTVTAPGLDPAINKTKTFREMLNDLNGRRVQSYIDVLVRQSYAQGTSGGGAQGKASALQRWGGVYTHAAEGVLRQADVFSAVSPARYAFAEPATGGEAFVPRHGDYDRSAAILNQAARWYGGRFMPGGGSGGGNVTTINLTVNAGMGTDGYQVGRQIAETLRPYINSRGGDVQVALGKG
jgi:hypothetical protein